MDWTRDLPTWPLHHLSARIPCPPHQWHVQQSGSGPTLLMLHGAGATTHTWRDLAPHFAKTHHVVALDLPGQGFTRAGGKHRLGLQEMTEDIARLCAAQDWRPDILIGHSAGAAIALNLAARIERAGGTPPRVVGLNAALGNFEGLASWLFPLFAKVLALNPLTAVAFTLGRSQDARARRLIESTGSRISGQALACYARLLADRSHVDGTLQMMARWDITRLIACLGEINAPCLLLAAENDLAVPPKTSRRAAAALPNADFVLLPALGHLAHEEQPELVIQHIESWLAGARADSNCRRNG